MGCGSSQASRPSGNGQPGDKSFEQLWIRYTADNEPASQFLFGLLGKEYPFTRIKTHETNGKSKVEVYVDNELAHSTARGDPPVTEANKDELFKAIRKIGKPVDKNKWVGG